jgi:cytochrome c553
MFKKTLLLASSVALLNATTTMCFKKEHIDPSTIDTVALEGGECQGKLSSEGMQRQGYVVSDIKISSGETGLNYIYIFKKDEPLATVTTDGKMILTKEDLKAKFLELQDEQKEEAKEKERVANLGLGKDIYENVCRRCHGDGTTRAYGVATPLVELDETQIIQAFREYSFSQKDNGMAMIMKPYVSQYNETDLKAISAYIRTALKQTK